MKLNRLVLLFVFLLFSPLLFSQVDSRIHLKNGFVQMQANIKKGVLDSFNLKAVKFQRKSFAILQFESIPTEATKKLLAANGIELLEYIPNNAYTVTISGNPSSTILELAKARAILQPSPEMKMESRLASGIIPPSAIKVAGTVDVWISFPKSFSSEDVIGNLKGLNFDILSTQYQSYRIISLRIASNRLKELASLPFVEYLQAAPAGDQTLNSNSMYGSRGNLLAASVANGGKGLDGQGVVVGIGDNADVQTAIDFAGRLINRAAADASGHGHHTTGTLGGAGNINEQYRGYAPKATIISQVFNGIILNAPSYITDYGMVVTNNSYGDNIGCSYHGTYDLYSRLLDQMAFDYPNLINVFAAGNSGASNCSPFLPTYHTVLGGYQSAKNVITVGATTDSGMVSSFSSRGPVKDGRLKPEIVAMGQAVGSSWPNNIYVYSNGTSMAAPAVSGGATMLYQRYRQLNSGNNPKNGLIKALLCNGSSDRGNVGPDYQYGFGWINLLRSVDMMENNRYFIANSTQGSVINHNVSIPSNTAQLKVMLYWNDPAASPLSLKTLVNDLDLEVSDGITSSLPKVLDTANANLPNVAISGADHTNNMEQIVIDNPVPGNYSLTVKGTAITQNPSQEYFLVYDIVPVQLKITAPVGGEALAPSTNFFDFIKIGWEAFGFSSGTVTIEFSSDGGSSWSTVASNVNINSVVYTWSVPNVATNNALVKITKDGSGESTISNPFTILAQPVVSLASTQCEGYLGLQWAAVTGASDYEVMMLQGDEMKSVVTTTASSFTFSGLSRDSLYWVSVRARLNGSPGKRSVAIPYQPNSGTCAGTISDNDLKIDTILAPFSGRKFTSTQLSSATAITVRVKNLDDVAVSNFDLKYSVNGGPFITENVVASIAAGATYEYTFTTTADLSAAGDYNLVTVVKNSTTDPIAANDTATALITHADNQPLHLAPVFLDDIETATVSTYEKNTVALNGLHRYDFSRSTLYGRLRTFVNSGIAYSGAKALTLDANRLYPTGNTNYLTGTFNLTNYNAATDDVRLDFQFNNHGQFFNDNNKVWIRGNDTQSWIEAYDLDNNQGETGFYKKSVSIEVSDLLTANGQSFSPSFQVRWGQWGQIAATDKRNAGGYSFDDIRLYQVLNDMQMLSIDAPVKASCALTNNTTIQVSVRNSSNSVINNVPVKYRINNGSWINETIASIAANSTIQYSFTTGADLSSVSTYTIQAIVDLANDSFRDNDTANATVVNSPVIASFPYLQNFESGAGSWYAEGENSSWQYGLPTSAKIKTAASGVKAWKTRLQGNYNDLEQSYLNSPCFDVTGMTNPTLSFSIAIDLEDCGAQLCDGSWVEYSTDGVTWTKLGASGQGTNWYKPLNQVWSQQDFTRWHVATIALPTGFNRLRLRIVMSSDPAVNREGIAIDDIHIYDNAHGIYDGITLSGPVTQAVSGNSWIDFTSGGKLIASVQPNNQNLGSTDIQAYINSASVRYTSSQYYLDRNITIKPASDPADSVAVRFYFLEKESDSLINASGCPGCTKPVSPYELGVSKYSDPDRNFENGSVSDNQQGLWNFITPDNVAKVPFDKGYYAEFKVRNFSEFWMNNGGFNKATALPVKMLDFTVQKQNAVNVLLQWKVTSEIDVSKYEIEMARGNTELQAGNFIKIGEVAGLGNSSSTRIYTFTDTEPDKFGPRYYRVKIIDLDGSLSYSPIRSVVFDETVQWQIYPNPSSGLFSLVYQLNNNQEIHARIINATGRLIQEYRKKANGFPQKLNIDLFGKANGVYLLQIDAGNKKQTFKLYKQ